MKRALWASIFFAFVATLWAGVAVQAENLEQPFANPPDSARPWVYWFWLNGNITREGITADLEAMKRVGIGGVLIMEVDQGAPLGPVPFMSDQWRDLFKFVIAEAQRLGLEVNMNNDAGWNGSGGPWIKPEESMQKIVFSETEIEGPKHLDGVMPQPQTTAGYYRDIEVLAFPAPGAYRIDNIAVKACYQSGFINPSAEHKDLPAEMVIAKDRVADITPKMDKDGHLVWDVPEGKWIIARFGHTSTGVENAPSPVSGRGLECDKLSKEGIEANYNGMMGKLIEDVGPAAGKTLVTTHIDSWENGAQNWTARMRDEFQRLRGYDPLPYLPVVTGRVVGSLEISERFLWDLRQTVSDLLVDNYAGHMRELASKHGVKLSIEAYGGPCDDAPYAGRADEPMAEFWIGGGGFPTPKEMASAAHTYGHNILGAESFTADDHERWLQFPGSIKALGDRAFCDGVNRFVFHRYALQPWTTERQPGMTMGPWGLHYERTNTWWDMSPAWHQYLARCHYMLRQGLFAADICYLEPEAAPQGFLNHKKTGYDFDNCSAEIVLTRMTVKDGRIVLPDGLSYKLLALPENNTMTPRLLKKIKELIEDGATVVGSRPVKSPSLADYPKCDDEIKQLADEIWADCNGTTIKEHRLGQGRVFCGTAPEKVLAQMGVPPDFTTRARLACIHRTVGGESFPAYTVKDTDIYFVANPQATNVNAPCTFRVSGKVPELWWPDTGKIEQCVIRAEKNGCTTVVLPLGPSASVFVVFRKTDKGLQPLVSLKRDGQPLITAAEPEPKIGVKKAVYGILTDPQKTRDVREVVQQAADAGDPVIHVSQLAQSGDPAPQERKTLEVEYTVGGESFPAYTVKGTDNDTVRLTVDRTKVTIEKAMYGMLDDPKRTRDVKEKLQHIVDAGDTSFEVTRLAQGDDPAVNIVKTAVIEYTVDGKHLTAKGTDQDTIDLVPVVSSEQVAEVHASPNGKPMLEAWQSGKYEVATASGKSSDVTVALPAPVEVAGPWDVTFPPKWAAPEHATFDKLISWSDHADAGIKYFSGTATYTKTIKIPAELLDKNRRLYLDLGKVQVMAQVKLNGKDLGTLWKTPYCLDITETAKAGDNALEIKVVNQWINRMIGDEQLPDDSERNPDGTLKKWPEWLAENKPSPTGRYTFTTWRLWKKDSPLQESGLIGPVTLRPTQLAEIEP